MKSLEKNVHFKPEGTSVGCYDSSGNPVMYMLIEGKPFIKIDSSVDRLLDIKYAMVHNSVLDYYVNHDKDQFGRADLKGVIGGRFISRGCAAFNYAERDCTRRELASFHLATYKAYKNAIKLEATK